MGADSKFPIRILPLCLVTVPICYANSIANDFFLCAFVPLCFVYVCLRITLLSLFFLSWSFC